MPRPSTRSRVPAITSCDVRSWSGPVPPPQPPGLERAAVIKVTCDGIEVTQSIQDLPGHSVPLVAGKRTVVRVYLSANSASPIMVFGLLKVRRTGSGGATSVVGATGPVTINPAESGQLRLKRENESKSLNFLIPAELTAAGSVEFKLTVVYQTTPFKLLVPPLTCKRTVTFLASPPLRVRILGIRYQAGMPAQSIEPNALDFALIRSWLQRAYPVAEVVWAHLIVNGPLAWPFDAAAMNAFVRGIRTTDVLGGVDARTHYYGLVSDGDGSFFMRGLASGIPGVPDPSTVASGPTGVDTWGWDIDGSYGDWYTGHELGHTFGRLHAMFCGAAGGGPYPFVNGQLSNADGAFAGLDTGDPARGLPMRALPGIVWHDVMTYCSFQWLSSFTYTGIRDRLVLEDALPAHGALPRARAAGRKRANAMSAGTVHVVATINLTRGTGSIRHVNPVESPTPGQRELSTRAPAKRRGNARAEDQVALRVSNASGQVLGEYPAGVIPDACQDPGDDRTGIVDAFLPGASAAARIELVLNAAAIDTFVAGTAVKSPQNIKRATAVPRTARARGRAGVADRSAEAVLTWTEAGAVRTRRRAGAEAAVAGRTYTVQVSTDDGASWQTVGFGLREPRVTIDRQILAGAPSVRVRVTSTDGFRSATSEKTFRAGEI